MSKILIVLVFLSLIFPGDLYAQVVINEMGVLGKSTVDSTDWIELYNYSADTVDLSSYKVKDKTGNELVLIGVLEKENWKVFDWSNRLDNNGDIVWLIRISDESVVEEIPYGNKGGVCVPADGGGSIGKTSDGGNYVERYSKSSLGDSNSEGTMDPCPTPTPVPTSTFTPTPTPTPEPTSTPTPTTTPTSTPTNTPTPKPTTNPVTEMPTPTESTDEDDNDAVLSLREGLTITPTPEANGDGGKKIPLGAVFLIFGGLSFMFASAYPLLKGKINIGRIKNVFKRKKQILSR